VFGERAVGEPWSIRLLTLCYDQVVNMQGTSRLPLGFKDAAQLAAFKADLEQVIGVTRVNGRPITALVLVTGASTTFYSDNPDTPKGHHWDSSGLGTSDYDIDVFSPELLNGFFQHPNAGANEEVLGYRGSRYLEETGKRVYCRNNGEAGFLQRFPQFESLVRRWEKALGRAIDFRLKLNLTPIAQLPDPPAVGPGPILLLRR
jgi:hypothetical protein